MFEILRCITREKESIIASYRDKESVKKLSREGKLICPNCHSKVIFKSGNVRIPHFAHYDSDCVIINYEPETVSHLKGKQILYEWLKKSFPTADVEYEVYIPETNQIADIFIEHMEGKMKGLRWAFEFQHSSLSSTDWEVRHNLYKSAGIQDYWILDKATFMKFSKAKDIENARLRRELEIAIYNKTGLCYFLDLESTQLTIDFKFVSSWHTTIVRGKKRSNEYTYHSPINHSAHIKQVRVRMNKEFKHGVLIYSDIVEQMKERLLWVLQMLRRGREILEEQKLQEKAKQIRIFANDKYGIELAEHFWKFMKSNREKLINDVRYLSEKEFLEKYEPYFERLQLIIQEFKTLKKSEDLEVKLIEKVTHESSFFTLKFLSEQGSLSLREYLRKINKAEIEIVTYAYNTYKQDLEKLASMRFKAIKSNLYKISPAAVPSREDNPTAIDFAIEYYFFETKSAVDEHIKKVKEQVIEYNPFINMDDLI